MVLVRELETGHLCEECSLPSWLLSSNLLMDLSLSTMEPLNKGHVGTQAAVPYSEVVPYWEVCIKLCFYSIIDVFGALK